MIITRRPPIIRARSRRLTRLAIFIGDCSRRSTWGEPVSLVRFAISQANAALMEKFQ